MTSLRPIALLLFAVGLAAQGTTTSIAPAADTTLMEDDFGQLANGGGSYLFCGKTANDPVRRTLLRFDVAAALPAGARIVRVELKMNVSRSQWTDPLPITIHRVTTPWTEGSANAPLNEGVGTAPNPGDVTWLHSSFPTQFWTVPGGDFDAHPIGVTDSPQSGPCLWPSSNLMVDDVQQWLDAPAGNYGWLLKTDEWAGLQIRRLDSRTASNASRRPVLLVTWIMPGQWAAAGAGCGAPAPGLSVSGSFTPGGTATFLLQGNAGVGAVNLYSLFLVQPGLALAPGCNLQLPPSSPTPGFHVLDGSGQATDVFHIPPDPSYSGLPLAGQGAVLDAAQPLGFALSNATFLLVL